MHIIAKPAFAEVARNYPAHATAIMDAYKTLESGMFKESHELKGTDFPEIGDKTLISKILNGSRSLTKDHITKLAERFDISPALFFD